MCGKIFSTEAQLKKHNRMHTDDSSLLPDDPDTTTKPQNDQATDPDLTTSKDSSCQPKQLPETLDAWTQGCLPHRSDWN